MPIAEMRVYAYTHSKGTTEVIEDDPGTGIAGVIHCVLWVGEKDGVGDERRDEMAVGVMLDDGETEGDDDALQSFLEPFAR